MKSLTYIGLVMLIFGALNLLNRWFGEYISSSVVLAAAGYLLTYISTRNDIEEKDKKRNKMLFANANFILFIAGLIILADNFNEVSSFIKNLIH